MHSCSKAQLFGILWAFEQVGYPECSNTQLFEGPLVWNFEQARLWTVIWKLKKPQSTVVVIFLLSRYERPIYDNKNVFVKFKLTSPNQLGRKFYCAKKRCILGRHPYFWKGRLSVEEGSLRLLTKVHLDYLFQEFHLKV